MRCLGAAGERKPGGCLRLRCGGGKGGETAVGLQRTGRCWRDGERELYCRLSLKSTGDGFESREEERAEKEII